MRTSAALSSLHVPKSVRSEHPAHHLPKDLTFEDSLAHRSFIQSDKIDFPMCALRAQRESLGWTRLELANKCGLSESTIRNIETGRHHPTSQTRNLIASVLDGVRRGDGSDGVRALAAAPDGLLLRRTEVHCIGADDTLDLREQLLSVLGGQGGYVQPALLLQEPACALKFAQFRNRHDPVARRLFWQAVARVLREIAGRHPLDVWALACADAGEESSLLAWLVACGLEQLRVLFVERSTPLLGAAMRNARALLRGHQALHVAGLRAELSELPQYRLWPDPRRQLFTLLWPQLDALASETRLLRQALWQARPRDLFLFGFELASTMPMGRLNELPPPMSSDFVEPNALLVPLVESLFRPHLRGDEHLRVSSAIEPLIGVGPSSFAVELFAEITSARSQPRRFSAWRSSRYEPKALAQSLKQEGWNLLAEWQDHKEKPATGLHLYERVTGEEHCASEARPLFGSRYASAGVDGPALAVPLVETDFLRPGDLGKPTGRRRGVTLCRAIERARCHAVQRRLGHSPCSVGERVAKLAHLLLQR